MSKRGPLQALRDVMDNPGCEHGCTSDLPPRPFFHTPRSPLRIRALVERLARRAGLINPFRPATHSITKARLVEVFTIDYLDLDPFEEDFADDMRREMQESGIFVPDALLKSDDGRTFVGLQQRLIAAAQPGKTRTNHRLFGEYLRAMGADVPDEYFDL